MDTSALAREIWNDLWEFWRVGLILIFGLCWSWFVSNRMGKDDGRSGLVGILLIAGCSVGAFGLFSFLNIDMENILRLARIAPLWGIFFAFSLTAIVVSIGFFAHRQLGTTRDETNLSILNAPQSASSWISPKIQLLGVCVAVMLVSISAGWLRLIAHGWAVR